MKTQWLALAALVAGGLLQSGCDSPVHALGGGGSTRPSVTVLLSDKAPEGEATTADAGGGATVDGYGTFKGRVVVTGTVPTLPVLMAKGAPTKDAICAANEIPDDSLVVGDGNGLGNVFVYLKRVPGGEIPPPPEEAIVVDQQGCRFVPRAAVVRVGQPLNFKNGDPVAHNTAFAPQGSASFNQTIVANDRRGVDFVYGRPEAVPVRAKCDYHAWMGAYHLPLSHPWGTVTAPDGTFEITGVPGTQVEFVVWHERAGYISRGLKVTIPVDGEVEQELTVDGAKLAGG
ncbi:MAG: hypothetical protein KF774_05485 [Planctomyces sp.]|nr:hypothetical protein [Planctomyces sp.]